MWGLDSSACIACLKLDADESSISREATIPARPQHTICIHRKLSALELAC